jgi:colicin import membrane protein
MLFLTARMCCLISILTGTEQHPGSIALAEVSSRVEADPEAFRQRMRLSTVERARQRAKAEQARQQALQEAEQARQMALLSKVQARQLAEQARQHAEQQRTKRLARLEAEELETLKEFAAAEMEGGSTTHSAGAGQHACMPA